MIPKEIDELMWAVAEGNDSAAISEFGDRHPAFREELLKRIRTIQALKAGGRSTHQVVPTFKNAEVRPISWKPLLVAAGLSILAISSFGIWRLTTPYKQPPPAVVPVNTQENHMPSANVVPNTTPQIQREQPSAGNHVEPSVNPAVVPNSTSPLTTSPEKTSLQLESATLHAAITLIAEAGHMHVTIAPGTPDLTIKIDFHDMTPMEMLKNLGEQYAFTPIMDGEREILIIPKKDEEDDQMTNETR